MVKYLIVEDERLSYQELRRMIGKLRTDYLPTGWAGSVAKTVDFLKNTQIDLILMDINLSDGHCFEIFDQINVSTPIIFTTAYDEHAIQAFKYNSIDYLLKPIEEEELSLALDKYERIHKQNNPPFDYKRLEEMMSWQAKERFLVQKKDSYSYVGTEEIAFLYSEEKVNFIHTFTNKRYIIGYTLDQLEKQLATNSFFRVSRNCISNIKAIKSIDKYFNGRLKLSFQPECPHEVLVSRVRVDDFLRWIDGVIKK